MEIETFLKCSHCNKLVKAVFVGDPVDVEIVYDEQAAMHVLRKKLLNS
jgi:hypothetical protein